MRCFIALDVSDGVRHSIAGVIETVKGLSRSVRWVSPGQIHLTLKFLGEVSAEMAGGIQERLSLLCGRHGRFVLTVSGAGGFPGLRHPNVLWAGINESEPLRLLHKDIEQSMAGLGFGREDKPFSPHLTIGRVKGREGLEDVIREWSGLKDLIFGSITVEEILLMKSILKPAGAEYSRMAVLKLDERISNK